MAIFKSNPEKSVQRDIDAAAKNRERLSAQLVEFEQAIERHAAAAKQAALNGDDADLDRAEAALRAAQDRSNTLKAALGDVEQNLKALDRSKAEIADRKLRAETAAEIELVVREMVEAGTEFDRATARLSEYTTRAVPWLWEARGLDDFVNVGRAHVPPAIELIGTMLRSYASDVIAGKAPATLPRPEPTPMASEAKPNVEHPAAPDVTSDPVLVAANFQRLDRRTGRVVQP
jgi:multidrug efflux pump subunit AcrA (membrane-fusion protein)